MDGLFASLLQALNTVPALIVPGEQGQAPTADPSSAAREAVPADQHPVPDEGGRKGIAFMPVPAGKTDPVDVGSSIRSPPQPPAQSHAANEPRSQIETETTPLVPADEPVSAPAPAFGPGVPQAAVPAPPEQGGRAGPAGPPAAISRSLTRRAGRIAEDDNRQEAHASGEAAAPPAPDIAPLPPGSAQSVEPSPPSPTASIEGRSGTPTAVPVRDSQERAVPDDHRPAGPDASPRHAEGARAVVPPDDSDQPLSVAAAKPDPAPMTPSGERTEASPPVGAVTPDLKPEPVTHPSPAAQLAPALAAVSTSPPAADGTHSVTVQLHPDSLGQVRVQIDQTAGGGARVAVTAERPETLNLLRHDAPALLNALDQAGVPATGRVVSFQVEPSSIPSAGPAVGHGDHRANEGDSRSTGAGPGDEAWRRGGDGSADQDERANQGGRRTWHFRSGLDITA